MAKVMSLDVGEKRIGLATTDELEIIASPYGFIERENAIVELAKLIENEQIEKLVIGMPFLPSGGLGSQANDVEAFSLEVRESIGLPIIFENEVLTSVEGEKRLKEMNKSFSKGDIDAMAATIILESYLRRSS